MKSQAVATEYRAMQRYIEQKGIALLDRGSQYIFTNGKFQQIPADSSVGSAVRALSIFSPNLPTPRVNTYV